ncbi:zinc-finger homeodomain protein 2-like [Cicer arietinum]|uniref:Zinc-finger homeodomain protein 2-like n=1 Tax=Cicer arietinum TaxID=3827 RepID=A0A1S2YTR7_CICAR|nr:zinc-finger homeodomain protein 2-like [Cicer arietinum]
MLFSIPLFVFFSTIFLSSEQIMEIEEKGDEMITVSSEPSYVETNRVTNSGMKMSNHEVEEARFKECRKNHSYGNGGYSLDGCLAFLPDGVEGTREFFICAACRCHRNFHRQETIPTAFPLNSSYHHQPTPLTTVYETPNGYVQMSGPPRGSSTSGGDGEGSSSKSKKRFRTKFTHQQKEKMFDFADKSGWKIRKKDDKIVEEFCNQIGVKCQVFKAWVHNNKHTLGNKP